MQTATATDLSSITPDFFTPLLGKTFWIEGAQGLRLEVEALSLHMGPALPVVGQLKRGQAFLVILALVEPMPHNLSGTFIVHLDGFPSSPVFINRVMPPLGLDPSRAYLQLCFG